MATITKAAEKTVLHIKVNKEDKERAKAAADALGMPLGTIISSLIRQFGYERELHLRVIEEPNEETAKRWREASADIKAGRNLSPAFTSSKEAMEWLNAQ